MRRYAIGLQLIVLLCSAVASGYLWRAALGTGRAIRYVSAGKPYEPPWPTPGSAGRVAVTHVPTSKPVTRHTGAKAARARSEPVAHSSAPKAAQLASASARPRAESSQPATSASAVAKVRDQTPPQRSAPAPAPSPPAPTPPSPSPRTPAASVAAGPTKAQDRPGWGYGDRNHDHAGPPA